MKKNPIDNLKLKYESGVFPHAVLVSGGTRESRRKLAGDIADLLLGEAAVNAGDGNCADLINIAPENGAIRVGAIKDLIERVRMKPFSAGRMLVVIEDSDLMNARAQNKLLKTLEEPSGDNVIMLLAANAGALRATIRSRCVKVNLGAGAGDTAPSVRDDAVKLISASFFGKAAPEAFAILDGHTDDPFPLLDAMEIFLRDIIVGVHEARLVTNEDNREIAGRMKGGSLDAFVAGVGIVEDVRSTLRQGGMNRKNALRDMALRLRTGGT